MIGIRKVREIDHEWRWNNVVSWRWALDTYIQGLCIVLRGNKVVVTGRLVITCLVRGWAFSNVAGRKVILVHCLEESACLGLLSLWVNKPNSSSHSGSHRDHLRPRSDGLHEDFRVDRLAPNATYFSYNP